MTLFATDIAARGLDFAKLDWVIQMDCPEDVPSYIHRVGRTARYVSGDTPSQMTPKDTSESQSVQRGCDDFIFLMTSEFASYCLWLVLMTSVVYDH